MNLQPLVDTPRNNHWQNQSRKVGHTPVHLWNTLMYHDLVCIGHRVTVRCLVMLGLELHLHVGHYEDNLQCHHCLYGLWEIIYIVLVSKIKYLLQEMMKALNTARGPLETAVCVSQVRHDIPILPTTFLSTWSTQVTRRWWAIMHSTQSGNK